MACLHPLRLRNPRYRDSDPNLYIRRPFDWDLCVPCGKCVECRKKEARDWRARLLLETDYWTKENKKCYFVTLTLSDDYYDEFALAPERPIRLWLENYRRIVGRSCRHFIITELGGKTSRLHYHGILFAPELSVKRLKSLWRYGFTFFGYCSYRTAKYVSKYIMKPQLFADWYKPKKFVSPGLGKQYLDSDSAKQKRLNPRTDDQYIKIDGYNYSMPRYIRGKLYTDEFRRNQQYDRYFKEFNYMEFISSLKIGNISFRSVSEFIRYRNLVYEETLARKASTPLNPPTDYLKDIRPGLEFDFINWDYGLNSDTAF